MSSLSQRLVVSGSITYAQRAIGSHIHRIDGYRTPESSKPGQVFRSAPFCVGRHKWQLLVYPNNDVDANNHQGFVSANLWLADWSYTEAAIATYSVSILGVAGNPAHSRTVGPSCRFQIISSDTEQPAMTTGIYELVAVEELW